MNYFNKIYKNISIFFVEYIYLLLASNGDLFISLTTKSEIIIDTTFKAYYKLIFIFIKHTTFRYNKISDMVVYDRPQYKARYVVAFILNNPDRDLKLRIRFVTNTKIILYSLTSIFMSLHWAEREVMDMFGLRIVGHPDLRRILGDYGFWGYPGRKTFPLVGIFSYFYVLNFLRVFRVRGTLSDFWSLYFQKKILKN